MPRDLFSQIQLKCFLYILGLICVYLLPRGREGTWRRCREGESASQSNGPEVNEQLQLAISGDTENPFAESLSQEKGSS